MRFYWLRDARRNPVAVIASQEIESAGDIVVRFALAAHNPRDKFDRALGRNVAAGRLQNNKAIGFVGSGPAAKEEIMQTIVADTVLPTKVRKAAQLWLASHRSSNGNQE